MSNLNSGDVAFSSRAKLHDARRITVTVWNGAPSAAGMANICELTPVALVAPHEPVRHRNG